MAISQWISCFFPEKRGLFTGAKIHLSDCLSCPISICPAKGILFEAFFPKDITPDESPLNRKLIDLNKKLQKKKVPVSRRYCPLKTTPDERCRGRISFCRYNLICEKFDKRDTKGFIRALRWRKTMIYLVQMKDGTSTVVDKKEFDSVDIDYVEKVYTAQYEVRVVTELVPEGEETERFTEVITAFEDKYRGDVVVSGGLLPFQQWFSDASTGESAYIPDKVLVPVKTYKVVKIKSPDHAMKPAASPKQSPETKQPEKQTQQKHQEKTPAESKQAKKRKTTQDTKTEKQPSLFDTPANKKETAKSKRKKK